MYIVHVASELAPVAKVGGLGDVVYGLCKELSRLGHQVEILLPKYDCLQKQDLKNLKIEQKDVASFDGPYPYSNTIWSAEVNGLRVLLIDPHHPKDFFNRGVIYGCADDIKRFTTFSRTAMEYLYKSGKQPDIIHVHDWPTALIPVLYKDMYTALGYRIGKSVLTVHNIEHQGRCLPFDLNRVGLKGENYLTPDKMQDPRSLTHINLLMGGIVYAEKITTVSPTYEKELRTAEGSFGLQKVLAIHRKKLKGILNGIDEDFWDPAKDSYLTHPYPTHGIDASKLPMVIKGKKENKRQLRARLKLEESNRPLVAAVTRLVPQKSPELIKHALHRTLEKGGQFVLLGSSQMPSLLEEFEALQFQLKNNKNAIVLMDKDEALAHQIFAAADLFLIPSLFEPCGLTQLIALRYGTVPLARKTGGLADTVFDVDNATQPPEKRNGFTFDAADVIGIDGALDRAIHCYQHEQQKWKMLMINGMHQDHGWKRAALEYLSIYERKV